MPTPNFTRREFLKQTSLAAMGGFFIGRSGFAAESPNNKLNIGVIGVANRARANIEGVKGENIVAICDIDDNYLSAAAQTFPEAKKYNDFRRLLERQDLDAVVISTADHTHAVATVGALRTGRHVYCEKPLAHTVSEARIVSETAREEKRATQMGTQIHAGDNYRRVVELIQFGAIGPVREVYNWVGSDWSGYNQPLETAPVPEHLHWDLWLGPVEHHEYSPAYHPARWRGYWDFGGGAMADMACHHMDLPFWALKLKHPTSVEAKGPDEVHPQFAPRWLTVTYQFPERGGLPPVKLTWHNGPNRPALLNEAPFKDWGGGTLFIGDDGMLLADYGKHVLLPEDKFVGLNRPAPFIPDSIGHYAEWIQACKQGTSTTCNFDYAGALTEAVLLGNVSYRSRKKLDWDARKLRAKNAPEAEEFIQHHYRKGWSI